MPIFTPVRRWQPPYRPFKHDPLPDRVLEGIERAVKGPLFGCRMCGNCLLQETAFICPMECPKGMRNGPCGGSTPEHCYVDETRACVWYRIYERSLRMGREKRLMEVLPPLDWEKVGSHTWMDVLHQWQAMGGMKESLRLLRASRKEKTQAWEMLFYEVRQPAWWRGDALQHPAPQHEPISSLEKKLSEGLFVVTAEISPPLAADPADLLKKLEMLRGSIDAANFTDNPSSTPRMSSLACSRIALEHGVEPILQIAGRDRTRMGFQSEVLGASALGIRNVLCLTGDHPRLGPEPHGRMDIWDLDAIQMVWLLRRMRDESQFLDCRELKCAPRLFIGAAGSPFASTPLIQSMREHKKTNAGAQFLQTQTIFDLEGFERYLEALDQQGVLQNVYVIAGVSPVKSVRGASLMNRVPGIKIPQGYFDRLEAAADPKEESIQMTLELIDGLKHLPGVKGIHFMAVGWESIVPRLIEESGLKREEEGVPS
jgi:5,10-methylenetetrahydrofolate reductase